MRVQGAVDRSSPSRPVAYAEFELLLRGQDGNTWHYGDIVACHSVSQRVYHSMFYSVPSLCTLAEDASVLEQLKISFGPVRANPKTGLRELGGATKGQP